MPLTPSNDNHKTTAGTCRECGSDHLEWVKDQGWVTGSWRYLRCRRCGDAVRLHVPIWTWLLYGIAAVAVVWTWISLGAGPEQ